MARPVGRPVDFPPEDFRRWYLSETTTPEQRAFARGQIHEWDRAIDERNGDEPAKPRAKAGDVCTCGHFRKHHTAGDNEKGCTMCGCYKYTKQPDAAQPEIPLREPVVVERRETGDPLR
jgi:hypothetical protein